MTRRSDSSRELCRSLLALVSLGIAAAHAADSSTRIVVNGVPLTADTVQALQGVYPVPIQPGRYWYDAVSGAYGLEGGPIAGQMMPGLRLGGAMRADASRGTSGVFINGRQLTLGEKSFEHPDLLQPRRLVHLVRPVGFGPHGSPLKARPRKHPEMVASRREDA